MYKIFFFKNVKSIKAILKYQNNHQTDRLNVERTIAFMEAIDSETNTLMTHCIYKTTDANEKQDERKEEKGGDWSWNEERLCTYPFCCDDASSHEHR